MTPRPRRAVLIAALLAGGAGPKPAVEAPPINRKVVEYAEGCVGAKVADGQCTALAVEALRSAGAKRFSFRGTGGDYVWGRSVDSFREALPGDVVQFRDAVFEGKSRVTSRRWVTWHHEYPHHTAIVSEVRGDGKIVVLLHQNVGPEGASVAEKQRVTRTTLRADSLRNGGRVWIYRPVAPGDGDDPAPARRSRPSSPPPGWSG